MIKLIFKGCLNADYISIFIINYLKREISWRATIDSTCRTIRR